MVLTSKLLKFACNIGTIFPPTFPLKDRLRAAHDRGFSSIEIAFPYSWSVEEWREGLEQYPLHVALINTPLGPEGQPGLAASQNKESEFLDSVRKGVEYCEALGCSSLHIMAGNEEEFEGRDEVFIGRMREASTMLKQSGITGLIETISGGVIAGYYLSDAEKTIQLVRSIACDNIFFQFDVFHLSMLGYSDSEIIMLFDTNSDVVKHVQVAQTPDRTQVDAQGGVCYDAIFRHLVDVRYGGYIGLEYKPVGDHLSDDMIEFLSKF